MLVNLDIAVEAGAWPGEAELRHLAEDAVRVAATVLAAGELPEAPRSPSPSPPHQPRVFPSWAQKSRNWKHPTSGGEGEISVLFTNDDAVRRLNARYRGRDAPTNVLSFPQESGPLLGDIVLAAETVRREAALAQKPLEDHIAHLIIHGFLHLLGYDHEADEEAETMEAVERAALARMGIADPYAAAQDR